MVSSTGAKRTSVSPSPPLSHILTVFFVARNSSSEYTNLPWVPAGIVIRNVYRSGFGLVRRQTAAIPQTMTINRMPRKTGFLPLVMAFIHSFFFFGINKRRLTRARTSDSQPFRCFLPFSPWRATARLRPKEQKSLENPRLSDAKQFCRSRNARRQGKGRREYFVYSQGL